MVVGPPGGRLDPPLPPRHGLPARGKLTLRNRTATRLSASLVLLLWLFGTAACSTQLASTQHIGCVLNKTGCASSAHHPERTLSSETHLSTGQDGEQQAATSSRRLLLNPDGQTAQQAAQQAVNRWTTHQASMHAATWRGFQGVDVTHNTPFSTMLICDASCRVQLLSTCLMSALQQTLSSQLMRRTEEDALNHILPYISQPMPCVNSDPVQFVMVDFHQPPNETNVLGLLRLNNVEGCDRSPCHRRPCCRHKRAWTEAP
jgi:hypothetical protein